jgi:HK97 family phage prohead protease
MLKEIRNTTLTAASALEVRATGNGNTVRGTAIVFNQPSQDMGFIEYISPSAINLQRDTDVMALWCHDSSRPLGRTTSGTLQLNLTNRGLNFTLDLPKSAADVREAISRGDVSGVSFGFTVQDDDWNLDSRGVVTRRVNALTLMEISPTTFPAYPQTDVALRSAPESIRQKLATRSDDGTLLAIILRRRMTI